MSPNSLSNSRQYCVHGVALEVATESPVIDAAAEDLLSHFHETNSDGVPVVHLSVDAVHDRQEIPGRLLPCADRFFSHRGQSIGDTLPATWSWDLYTVQERTIVDFYDQGRLVLDFRQGRGHGYLIAPETKHPTVCATFLFFALAPLLGTHGLQVIHGAALEKDGRAVLFSGASGQGKTTCGLALLRAGYHSLSDDHPLLRSNGTGVELLSFPLRVHVTDTTVAFFPELKAAQGRFRPGIVKRSFQVDDIYPNAHARCGVPVLVLVPRVVNSPQSYLEPLTKSQALEELVRQGLVVLDQEVAGRQFEALTRLVEQAECYRLCAGEDVLDLPRLIDPLLTGGRRA